MTGVRNARMVRWMTVAGAVAALAVLAAVVIVARPATARQTSAPPGAAAPPAAGDPGWLPRYDFALEVDGKLSPDACFYQELNSRRIMINAPELSKVCILSQEGKHVISIDRVKVKVEAEGEVARLSPGAEAGAASSPYTIDSASVVFYVGTNRLKIVPKQPLVGPTTADDLLRHSPLYRKGRDAYSPEAGEIAYLKSYATPVDIEVFFGTWCPHCKVVVPRFMRTIQAAANANLRVSYHGVPSPFDGYEPARVSAVKGIPTFIFRIGGREVGRIPGEPTSGTVEHAIAEILRAAK
ncbi:MAG TPA: thioredoxin family protein [Candidatus Polarisedimenticolia bacterium]|jgi:thiol-disulfide isomerase/thioredoxin